MCVSSPAREACGVNGWPASPKIRRLTPNRCTPTCLTSPPLWPLNTGRVILCVSVHVYSCTCVCVCVRVCVCVCVYCFSVGVMVNTMRRRRRGDFNPQLSTPKVRLKGWKENLARPLCVVCVCVCVCVCVYGAHICASLGLGHREWMGLVPRPDRKINASYEEAAGVRPPCSCQQGYWFS